MHPSSKPGVLESKLLEELLNSVIEAAPEDLELLVTSKYHISFPATTAPPAASPASQGIQTAMPKGGHGDIVPASVVNPRRTSCQSTFLACLPAGAPPLKGS